MFVRVRCVLLFAIVCRFGVSRLAFVVGCVLIVTRCVLFVVRFFVSIGLCLFVGSAWCCFSLFGVRCLLCVAKASLCVVCCLLCVDVVRCLWLVCFLAVVCQWLFVVCCL